MKTSTIRSLIICAVLLLLLIAPCAAQSPLLTGPTSQGYPGNLTVHYLDAGQGDAELVVSPNGRTMLIDAGEMAMGGHVTDALAAEGIPVVDLVVATHAHADHIGGMRTVLKNVTAGMYLDNGRPATTITYLALMEQVQLQGIPYRSLTAGETVSWDPSVTITVLNPQQYPFQDQNEDSVVLRLTYGNESFLFMGDASTRAEDAILTGGVPIASDVLKVGHHGSSSASGAAFLAAVHAEISVIEVGAGNPYGHPAWDTLQRLEESGSTVYRTDLDGTITVTSDGIGYLVKTSTGPSVLRILPQVTAFPSDPDQDGRCEDLNGNGSADFADVVLFFNQIEWISQYEPVQSFDMNGNGRIDFGDIVTLFNQL